MTASKADQVIRLGASIAGYEMDGHPLRVPCSNTTHDFVSTNAPAGVLPGAGALMFHPEGYKARLSLLLTPGRFASYTALATDSVYGILVLRMQAI